MSGLDNNLIEYATIEISEGKSFEIRGLNASDIMAVVRTHTPVLMKLYSDFKAQHTPGKPFTLDVVRGMLEQTLREADDLVYILIASAADQPDKADVVRRLPMRVQLEAMEKTVFLSIQTEAELKKLQEVVLRIVAGVTSAMELSATAISSISGGTSAKE